MADALDRKLRAFEKKMAKEWHKRNEQFAADCMKEFKKQKIPAVFTKARVDPEEYLFDTIELIRKGDIW